MTVPTHASCDNNCNAHYTAKSGQIVVRANQYKNYQSCLWTIDVGTGNSIEFTFDKKAGFDVEFHHKCGYDKLHIFSGNMQGKPERVARFCGPKDGEKPFDGSGKILAVFRNISISFFKAKIETSLRKLQSKRSKKMH